jgi:hypothetical protein
MAIAIDSTHLMTRVQGLGATGVTKRAGYTGLPRPAPIAKAAISCVVGSGAVPRTRPTRSA